MLIIYNNFLDKCKTRRIDCQIKEGAYLNLRDEFKDKVNWWQQTQDCVDWLYDQGFKKITTNRLRNRMKSAIRFQTDKERIAIEKLNKKPAAEKPSIEPLWTEPK